MRIRAFDTEGNLLRYALDAHYGNNQHFSPVLAAGSYPGTGTWQGVSVELGAGLPEVPPADLCLSAATDSGASSHERL